MTQIHLVLTQLFLISHLFFQVLEYDSPEKLLSNEESAFSRMVQSTGRANAQYLCSLVLGGQLNKMGRQEKEELVGQRKWMASSSWTVAAQLAVAVTLSSSWNDLQNPDIEDKNNILVKTKDAVITLQGVLEGKHDKDIDETLNNFQVPRDGWWSALYRMVEGTIATALHA